MTKKYRDRSDLLRDCKGNVLFEEEFEEIRRIVLGKANTIEDFFSLISRLRCNLGHNSEYHRPVSFEAWNEICNVGVSPGIAAAILEQIGFDIETKVLQTPVNKVLKENYRAGGAISNSAINKNLTS